MAARCARWPIRPSLPLSPPGERTEQVGLGEAVVNPILGMETPFAYRNKAQYAVRGSEAGAEIGFYRKHPMTSSPPMIARVQDRCTWSSTPGYRNWMREHDIAAYDEVATPAACAT